MKELVEVIAKALVDNPTDEQRILFSRWNPLTDEAG